MEKFDAKLQQLFRREVTDKINLSALAFGLFAVYTLFSKLGCVRFAPEIQVASALIMLCSFFRWKLYQRFQTSARVEDSDYRYLQFLISLNGFFYGVIFTLGSIEHAFSGVYYMTILGLICGFVSASMVTLSGDLWMFLPFMGFLLLPQIFILAFDLFTLNLYRGAGVLLLYSVYLLYQLKCVFELRARWKQAFSDQLQVIESAEEIKRGHEIRLQQELKIVHTSRLASLGEMASGIAHEVNNPLTIVSISLEVLKRKISDLDGDTQASLAPYLDKSLLAIQRVGKITNGLKHFSRQSDHTPKQESSIRAIVEDTVNFCGEILKTHRIDLRTSPVSERLRTHCHAIQISQVLVNLIKNAEDALDAQEDSKRWVQVSVQEQEKSITIQVSNGGPEIPDEVKMNLFKPYFSTKAEKKGTGLGLSISREIAREHGGDLILLPEALFTTFEIRLPKAEHQS